MESMDRVRIFRVFFYQKSRICHHGNAQIQLDGDMNDPTTDVSFWKWAGGALLSMLSGAAVGGWVARGLVANLEQRLKLVETAQTQCKASLKDDIREIVNTAINEHALSSAATLESIRTQLAVILDRMDRRKEDARHPLIHGERRDQ